LHELSLVSAVLDHLEVERNKRPRSHLSTVGIRIGAVSGVDQDSFRFGFEMLVKGSPWEPLKLQIEMVDRRQRCPSCGKEFNTTPWETACSGCGNTSTQTIAGEELQIAYVEFDR
jgi:hydrogenase nickel incorporation protein HypA/HybF